MGLAGENENDKKNEVPETTGASTRNLLALATNQLKRIDMSKYLILFGCTFLAACALVFCESANIGAGIASFVAILGILAYEFKCEN